MSNWKHAYGWSGHILVSQDESDGSADDNVVAVEPSKFRALAAAHSNCKVDGRIHTEQLGITSEGEIVFLACGTAFSEAFKHFGTVFLEAEIRAEPGGPSVNGDSDYLSAMKEVYGIDLPPCRLMIGCSSEH